MVEAVGVKERYDELTKMMMLILQARCSVFAKNEVSVNISLVGASAVYSEAARGSKRPSI